MKKMERELKTTRKKDGEEIGSLTEQIRCGLIFTKYNFDVAEVWRISNGFA